MSKIEIVIEREYTTRVKKKSFLLLTLLLPLLMVGVVSVPVLFATVKGDDTKVVAVIDHTGKYAPAFVQMTSMVQKQEKKVPCIFAFRDDKPNKLNTDNSEFSAVVEINDDLAKNPKAVCIYSRKEVPLEISRYVSSILDMQIRRDKLGAYNIPNLDKIITDIQSSISIKTVKWSNDGNANESSSDIAVILGMLSAILIYMFVMMYGSMVMQGVMEEKTNRIIEVIVGSVRPMELMLGKIIGIMLVGLTQMAVWIILMVLVSEFTSISVIPQIAEEGVRSFYTSFLNMPLLEIILMFVLYFIGGFLLYASFYAAAGAAVNSQEDSSQFMMPMILIMIAALYAAMGSIDNTDGPMAFWASLFPLTSPIVMMVRIPFGVPLWQELLSVGILYFTAFICIWCGSRIYRVGILMYGKKPTLKEILRWMRYK